MNPFAPLQKDLHNKVKIDDTDMSHIADQHMVPLVIHEFTRAAGNFPIAFVKNSNTGQFQSIAILGLKPKSNHFIRENKWHGGYMPLSVCNNPLCLMIDENNNNAFIMGINETSSRVNLDRGQRIFNDDNSETEFFTERKNALLNFYEMEKTSQAITQLFAELNLLQEETISLTLQDQQLNFSGVYLINEEKLNALPDQQFLLLKNKSLLPAIYAHLSSFQHLGKLASLASEQPLS